MKNKEIRGNWKSILAIDKNLSLLLQRNISIKRAIVIILSLYVGFILLAIYFNISIGDEKDYHLPNAINIYENGLIKGLTGKAYSAANTPLPYIINSNYYLFPPSLVSVRIVTLIFSFAIILLIFYWFNRLNYSPSKNLLISLSFLFYPYFIRQSILFHAPIYGLIFIFAFLYKFKDDRSLNKPHEMFIYGLLLSLSSLSQQFYISFYIALLAVLVFNKYNIKQIIICLLPIILPLLTFVIWGGMTHPNFRAHNIIFDPTHFTATVEVIGLSLILFLPIFKDKIFNKNNIILIILAIAMNTWFAPQLSEGHGLGKMTGMTIQLINRISDINENIGIVFQVIITFLGLFIIINFATLIKNNKINMILYISAIIFIVIFTFNSLLGEKHLIGLVFTLYFLGFQKLRMRYSIVMCLVNILIGSYYIYKWIFIKTT